MRCEPMTRIRNSHGFASQADSRESDIDSQAFLILYEPPYHSIGASYVVWAQNICNADSQFRLDSQAKRIRASPTPIRTCAFENTGRLPDAISSINVRLFRNCNPVISASMYSSVEIIPHA